MRFLPQLKLASHREFIDYVGGKSVVPINIEISPSGICDANCQWCFYRKSHSRQILNTDILIKFLVDAWIAGVKAITLTGGGEPTLHPEFDKIIKAVSMEQGLITNGLKIPKYDPKVFSWIRVSKTDKNWNIEALKHIRECKTVGLCINYEGNEQEVEDSLRIVYDLNLDYLQVRPALRLRGNKTYISEPKLKDDRLLITSYKFEDASRNRLYTRCEGFHFVPFLWEDGNLDVCAYKKGNVEYTIGNIYKDSFSELIKKFPAYVDVESDCQICCKNHEINTLIHMVKNIEDKNFV